MEDFIKEIKEVEESFVEMKAVEKVDIFLLESFLFMKGIINKDEYFEFKKQNIDFAKKVLIDKYKEIYKEGKENE